MCITLYNYLISRFLPAQKANPIERKAAPTRIYLNSSSWSLSYSPSEFFYSKFFDLIFFLKITLLLRNNIAMQILITNRKGECFNLFKSNQFEFLDNAVNIFPLLTFILYSERDKSFFFPIIFFHMCFFIAFYRIEMKITRPRKRRLARATRVIRRKTLSSDNIKSPASIIACDGRM